MNKFLIVLGMMCLILPSIASATCTLYKGGLGYALWVENEGSSGSPINFSYIVDCFEDNPVETPLMFPQTYGGNGTEDFPYELTENNSQEWFDSGDVTNIVNSSIKLYGNKSIGATKNGSADFILKWDGNNGGYVDIHENTFYFYASMGQDIRFYINVTNSSIRLKEVEVWNYYSGSNPEAYGARFDNNTGGWDLTADVWNAININIRDDGVQVVKGRMWWYRIVAIYLEFEGGISGDEIYVDGLRFQLDDPNPKHPYGNFYYFPMLLYTSGNYFSDKDFVFFSDTLSGGSSGSSCYDARLGSRNNHQFDLGEYDTTRKMGAVFYGNSWASDDTTYSFCFYDSLGGKIFHITGMQIEYPGKSITGAYSGNSAYGGYLSTVFTSDSSLEIKYTNIYGFGELLPSNDNVSLTDVQIHGSRYHIRGYTYGVWDDVTFYPGGYPWIDVGALKGAKYVGFTSRLLYQRCWHCAVAQVTNLTNADFSESTDASNIYMQYAQDGDDTGNLSIYLKNTIDLKIIDNDGEPIENANVTFNASDGTITTLLTDSEGIITSQDMTTHKLFLYYITGATSEYLTYYPKTNILTTTLSGADVGEASVTEYNPYTLTITKGNYSSREFEFNITEETDWVINLEKSYAYIETPSSGYPSVKVFGSIYASGNNMTTYATVYDADHKTTDSATCNVSYYSMGTELLTYQPMTFSYGGTYYYNTIIPSNFTKTIFAFVNCSNPSVNGTQEIQIPEWIEDIPLDVWNYTQRTLTYYPTGIITVTETAVGGYVNRTYFSAHPNHVLANETPDVDVKMYKYAWLKHNIYIEEMPSNITYAEVCTVWKRFGAPTGNISFYLNDEFIANQTIDAHPTYWHWHCENISVSDVKESMEIKVRMPLGLTAVDNIEWGIDEHIWKGFTHTSADNVTWDEYTNGEVIAYVKVEAYEVGTGEAVWTYSDRSLTDYNQTEMWAYLSEIEKLLNLNRVLYLPMGEGSGVTAYDYSGYNNDGTLNMNTTGNITSGWNTSGKYDGALLFDGINDYVDCGHDASINLTSSFTLAAWIKSDGGMPLALGVSIIEKEGNVGNRGYAFEALDSFNDILRVTISEDGLGLIHRDGITDVLDGTWHHVAATYDSVAQTLNVFVDGINDDDTLVGTVPTSISISSVNLTIGAGNAGTGTFWNGTIDEVKIWNRPLSSEEIKAEYETSYWGHLYDYTGEINQTVYDILSNQTAYFSDWNTSFYFWNDTYFVNWNDSIMNLEENWDTLWEHFNCSNTTIMSGSVCAYLKSIKTTTEESKTLLEDIEDYVERIPGIKNVVGSLSSAVSTLGFSHSQSFLISIMMMSILGFLTILIGYSGLRERGSESEEEETVLL